MMTSLDTSCRDQHQKRPKHAELGVFEAEKYYKMEIDSRGGLDLDLKLGQPIVCSVVDDDDRKNVETRRRSVDDPRPKDGSCPKSRENNASFYCIMRGLCSNNEPKPAATGEKTSVRLIRTTTKSSCPDRRLLDQIIMPKACPPASPNRPLKVSDKTNPNKGHQIYRDRADIEASLDRRLAVLTWDAIPGARKMLVPAVVRKLDGYESDASSELFEIQSLSVSTRQSASTIIMPRISVARRGPAGGIFMGCSGQKSTAVCETNFMEKPKHG